MNPTAVQGLRCGIAIRTDLNQSILLQANGATQNAKFLMDLLLSIGVDAFFLTSHGVEGGELGIAGRRYRARQVDAFLSGGEAVDVVLEASLILPEPARSRYLDRYGCAVVTIHYGNILVMMTEDLFLRPNISGTTFQGNTTEAWTSPHYRRNRGFLETVYDAPVRIAPYIWEPDFVGAPFRPEDFTDERDVFVMEPNFNVTKTALIPMAVIERVYREAPEAFRKATILNGLGWREQPSFLRNIVQNFDSLKAQNHKVFFAGRHGFDEVFRRPDVLLSHQWENELNYLHCEALYKGVPLVHNAPPFRELGFYYDDCEVGEGAERLLEALAHRPSAAELARGREWLTRYSIHAPENQTAYAALLGQLMETRP